MHKRRCQFPNTPTAPSPLLYSPTSLPTHMNPCLLPPSPMYGFSTPPPGPHTGQYEAIEEMESPNPLFPQVVQEQSLQLDLNSSCTQPIYPQPPCMGSPPPHLDQGPEYSSWSRMSPCSRQTSNSSFPQMRSSPFSQPRNSSSTTRSSPCSLPRSHLLSLALIFLPQGGEGAGSSPAGSTKDSRCGRREGFWGL